MESFRARIWRACAFVALLLLAQPVSAQSTEVAGEASSSVPGASEPGETFATSGVEEHDPFEWFALPLVGYNSDIGFAGMILGMFFWYEDGYEPYRDRLQVVASLTTEKVTWNQIAWERVGVFGWPVRMEFKAGFTATPVANYCGLGNVVSCDEDVAEQAGLDQGLAFESPELNRFVDRYYRFRAMRPELGLSFRYQPSESGAEFSFAWSGRWNVSGFFGSSGPYPGSLYGDTYVDGEQGLLSELQVGVLLDRRDHERRPTRGYLVGATARGAGIFIGSNWNFAGATFSGAGYLNLDRSRRLIWANRLVADLLIGDAPTVVLGSVGGFWSDLAFGGQFMGRGIRARRYIGRIKLIGQSELRWAFVGAAEEFQFVVQTWVDAGWIGEGYRDFGGDVDRMLLGFGGGASLYWSENFVVRFDVGFSAHEDYEPFFYLTLSHPF